MTRNYYLLLCGYFVSSVGNSFYSLAIPLLVYEVTGSAQSMAITYGLVYLPYVLFLPIGGIFADRVDRRRLLVFGDLASTMMVSLLAFAVWQQVRSMWIIYPAAFILAGVSPFYHPAFQSIIPSLVSDPQLPRANAWLHGAENIVALAGPLLGGIFIAAFGTTHVLFLDALSFFVSALLIAAIRIQVVEATAHVETASSWLEDLREGFQYTWKHPIIRSGSLFFMGVNFADGVIEANYVYFLIKVLSFTPAQIGLIFGLSGLGTSVGVLMAPRLGRLFQPGALILGCNMIAGLMTLPLLVARGVLSVAVPWTLVISLETIIAVTWFTLRQRVVPQHILGRVVGFNRWIAFAALPVAAVFGGALMDATQNIYLIIALAAFVRMAVGSLGFLTPLYRQRLEKTRANS